MDATQHCKGPMAGQSNQSSWQFTQELWETYELNSKQIAVQIIVKQNRPCTKSDISQLVDFPNFKGFIDAIQDSMALVQGATLICKG